MQPTNTEPLILRFTLDVSIDMRAFKKQLDAIDRVANKLATGTKREQRDAQHLASALHLFDFMRLVAAGHTTDEAATISTWPYDPDEPWPWDTYEELSKGQT